MKLQVAYVLTVTVNFFRLPTKDSRWLYSHISFNMEPCALHAALLRQQCGFIRSDCKIEL